jgi:integrase
MSRNTNGEGSIYQRRRDGKPLRWEGAISYADADGNTKRHTVYGRTRAEVVDKLRTARARLESGAPVRDASRTVGDWFAQWRSGTLAASARKPATIALYATLCRTHLETGRFAAITLDRLRASDVDALILELRGKGLSDSTVRTVYTVARAAIDGAVRDGLLARNPVAQVARPAVARREAAHLSAGEVARVLAAATGSRYYPALLLIAATGLRRGECLALTWDQVDLEAGSLRVAATLGRVGRKLIVSDVKTARSRRTVPLSDALVEMLRRHRVAQLTERLRAGDRWQDTGLVFCTEHGRAVEPRNLLRVIEAAAAAAGVAGVGVHTLRHSVAVAWLESGVHVKAVADLLGHSSIAITGDVYGHTSDQVARGAIDSVSDALGI